MGTVYWYSQVVRMSIIRAKVKHCRLINAFVCIVLTFIKIIQTYLHQPYMNTNYRNVCTPI